MRFLIIGCQRSGTTMLAALLARHPELVVHDEEISYRLLSTSPLPDGVFKVPRWGDLLPGPTFGDPDQALERPFKWTGEPMVHIVRDPLDVAASMDRLQMSPGVPWLDRYGVPLTEWRLDNNPKMRRALGWVLDLPEGTRRWACAGAYWWIKNQAALRHLDEGRPLRMVVYEDLVRDPSPRINEITRWMGVGPLALSAPSRLENPAGGTDPQRVPDKASIGRGLSLSDLAVEVIQLVVGDLYPQLISITDTGKSPS